MFPICALVGAGVCSGAGGLGSGHAASGGGGGGGGHAAHNGGGRTAPHPAGAGEGFMRGSRGGHEEDMRRTMESVAQHLIQQEQVRGS
jgi:hypothetical protein